MLRHLTTCKTRMDAIFLSCSEQSEWLFFICVYFLVYCGLYAKCKS
jgi:hypothetical protein